MISRRTLLAASMATLSAPLLTGLAGRRAAAATKPRTPAQTPATLPVKVKNNTGSDTVYAFVTGLSINNGNALMLIQADGKTPYYPVSPPSSLTPLAKNCAIPLNKSGGTAKTITIPYMAGARLWFSIGSPLTFYLNPGPALVEPSVTNPSDPNINLQWDFCEFTYNGSEMFADISYVDFVCIPIGMTLTSAGGTQQKVPGLPAGGLDTVCSKLTAQAAADGNPWTGLIVTSNGQNLRALSPSNGIVLNPSFLQGYYQGYVDQVWQKYESATLTVDTQASWGTVTGQVTGGLLTFPGVGSFAQPTTADIFDCDGGPFNPNGMSPEMLAVVPRLAAAFNRSTLLTDSNQPDGENPAEYYTNAVTNHYARIVHATTRGHLGYAFPFDDVTPDGGVNQSGPLVSPAPTKLQVTVGPVH